MLVSAGKPLFLPLFGPHLVTNLVTNLDSKFVTALSSTFPQVNPCFCQKVDVFAKNVNQASERPRKRSPRPLRKPLRKPFRKPSISSTFYLTPRNKNEGFWQSDTCRAYIPHTRIVPLPVYSDLLYNQQRGSRAYPDRPSPLSRCLRPHSPSAGAGAHRRRNEGV